MMHSSSLTLIHAEKLLLLNTHALIVVCLDATISNFPELDLDLDSDLLDVKHVKQMLTWIKGF